MSECAGNTRRTRTTAVLAGAALLAHTGRDSARGDYTVRSGHTLSGIAAAGTTWQRIHAVNKSVIGGDPGAIVPGRRLEL